MSVKLAILLLSVAITMGLETVLFAQSGGFTLQGEVLFTKPGDIHIYLVTEEVFKKPFSGVQELLIKIGHTELREKSVSFTFEGVQQGIYGIRCFQDVNGNGVLDKGFFGPKEPWGMSWQGQRPSKWPRFDDIAFEVNATKRDIHIVLR